MSGLSFSIYYKLQDYNAHATKVVGRMSANSSLLHALIDYPQFDKIGIYIQEQSDYDTFSKIFSTLKTRPILFGDVIQLAKSGLYFHGDPLIERFCWARSSLAPQAYSVCGLTHTLSEIDIIAEIGRLLVAPCYPWDAIICTSKATKNILQRHINNWTEYYATQGCQVKFNPQLPIIPLGLRLEEMLALDIIPRKKAEFRQAHGIPDNALVVTFVGRLSFFSKANPLPMLLALEKLQQRIQQTVYFMLGGWFARPEDEAAYTAAVKLAAPHIKIMIFNPLHPTLRNELLAASDIFFSLVDNIQETFGLTPLEAMAHALPVVVSDWDGYKESVRHGIDGFRVPTLLAPAGCGRDISLAYALHAINHDSYCGLTAQFAAVDVDAAAEALYILATQPQLRQEMGQAARKRIEQTYDWRIIAGQYHELWSALSELRNKGRQLLPAANLPVMADPLALYSDYATAVLHSNTKLQSVLQPICSLADLQNNIISKFGTQQRLGTELLSFIIKYCLQPQSVADIVQALENNNATVNSGIIVRSIAWLIKYNLLMVKA